MSQAAKRAAASEDAVHAADNENIRTTPQEEAPSSSKRGPKPKKIKIPSSEDDSSEEEENASVRKGKKPAKTKATTSSQEKPAKLPMRSVLQLKITLRDVQPEIWRRIQVLNNVTFADLRNNINEAMGWMSNRSHQFIIYDSKKNANILVVDGGLSGLTYDFGKDNKGRLLKEQNTKLCKFFNAKGDTVLYEFDLGDSWIHEVVLEKVFAPAVKKTDYPRCMGGKRACPPEDCGGVEGFHHLLEVYQDPNHAEYEELISGWLFDMYPGYNPEYFNKKRVFPKEKKPKKMWVWLPGKK